MKFIKTFTLNFSYLLNAYYKQNIMVGQRETNKQNMGYGLCHPACVLDQHLVCRTLKGPTLLQSQGKELFISLHQAVSKSSLGKIPVLFHPLQPNSFSPL